MAAKGFGGRPKREPEPGERVTIAFRVTPEMKQRLEEAAAKSGRSQSQEAELRLERSFEREGFTLHYGEYWSPVLIHKGDLVIYVGDNEAVVLPISPPNLRRLKAYFRTREEPKKL